MKVACGRGKGSMVGAGDAFSMLFDLGSGFVPECLFLGDDAAGRGWRFGDGHGKGDGWCGCRGCACDGARWQTGAAASTASAASTGLSAAAAGVLLSAALSSAGCVSAAGLCAALSAAAGVSISTSAAATATTGLLVSGTLVSVCAAALAAKTRQEAGT